MTVCDDIDWVGLGKALREARDLCHRSQESAADKLCLSRKQIRALESGSGIPFPGDTVRSWCARRYATQLGLDWERIAQPLRSDALEDTVESGITPETATTEPAPGAGKQFRLRGKGIKGVRSSYPGDLYCHILIETPVKLTEHQRKLLRELDDSLNKGGSKHSPTGDSWTNRLKSFFS